MIFCFGSILQIWIVLIGFRITNDLVNLGICKHEFKVTCRGYCRFTLNKRFQGFISEILRTVKSYRRKANFFHSLRATEILWSLTFPFLNTFQNNVNYTSTPYIQEVMKFCGLGDQSLETNINN